MVVYVISSHPESPKSLCLALLGVVFLSWGVSLFVCSHLVLCHEVLPGRLKDNVGATSDSSGVAKAAPPVCSKAHYVFAASDLPAVGVAAAGALGDASWTA